MSESHPRAREAVRKHRELFEKGRWPSEGTIPSTLEVLSGAEMVGGDVYADARAVLGPLNEDDSPHKMPPKVALGIQGVLGKPTTGAIRWLQDEIGAVMSMWDSDKSGPRVLSETMRLLEDLHDRCAIWLAAIGSAEANRRCAMLCVEHFGHRPISGYVDVITWGLARSAIDYLATAAALDRFDEDDVDTGVYLPESRHVQIESSGPLVRGFVHVLGLVQDVLDEPPAPPEAPVDDLSVLAQLVQEDRAEVARNAEPEPKAPEDGQTYAGDGDARNPRKVILVGDVSHVQKVGKNENDPIKQAVSIINRELILAMPPEDLAAARAELVADCPHGHAIIDRLLRPLAGQDAVKNPPVLLVGEPGSGKTRLARRYGQVLRLDPSLYSMGGSMDAMTVSGVARGWSSGGFSAPVRELIRTGIANPLIVMDEVDKMATSRQNGNAADALINQIGVETAARYKDIYLQADVNISHIQWILTANTLDTVPRPLLDRCLILRMPDPEPEHLRPLAASILTDVRLDRGLDEQWVPPFEWWELEALEANWANGGSLRALRRLVEAVLDAREAGPRQ